MCKQKKINFKNNNKMVLTLYTEVYITICRAKKYGSSNARQLIKILSHARHNFKVTVITVTKSFVTCRKLT